MVYFAGQLILHWEVQRILDKPCAAACKTLWQCTPPTHTFPYSIISVFDPIVYHDGAASGRRLILVLFLRRRRVWATANEEWDGGLGSCLVPGFVAPLP